MRERLITTRNCYSYSVKISTAQVVSVLSLTTVISTGYSFDREHLECHRLTYTYDLHFTIFNHTRHLINPYAKRDLLLKIFQTETCVDDMHLKRLRSLEETNYREIDEKRNYRIENMKVRTAMEERR